MRVAVTPFPGKPPAENPPTAPSSSADPQQPDSGAAAQPQPPAGSSWGPAPASQGDDGENRAPSAPGPTGNAQAGRQGAGAAAPAAEGETRALPQRSNPRRGKDRDLPASRPAEAPSADDLAQVSGPVCGRIGCLSGGQSVVCVAALHAGWCHASRRFCGLLSCYAPSALPACLPRVPGTAVSAHSSPCELDLPCSKMRCRPCCQLWAVLDRAAPVQEYSRLTFQERPRAWADVPAEAHQTLPPGFDVSHPTLGSQPNSRKPAGMPPRPHTSHIMWITGPSGARSWIACVALHHRRCTFTGFL